MHSQLLLKTNSLALSCNIMLGLICQHLLYHHPPVGSSAPLFSAQLRAKHYCIIIDIFSCKRHAIMISHRIITQRFLRILQWSVCTFLQLDQRWISCNEVKWQFHQSIPEFSCETAKSIFILYPGPVKINISIISFLHDQPSSFISLQ